MKLSTFLVFLSIVIAIYSLLNFYIFIRGWQALGAGSTLRPLYLILFLAVAACFFAGRILERFALSLFTDILVWIGSFWLAAMLYLFLIVLLLDIIRLVNLIFPVWPAFIRDNYGRAKLVTFWSSVGLTAILLIAGHINALTPRLKRLDIAIPKNVDGAKSLSIVVASDIHLGTLVGRSRLDHLVETINELSPDLVLLPGDIVDEDLAPVIRENLGETLRSISAPLGVYAVTGNHEYIGGVEAACRYLTEHNVTVLRDTAVLIDDRFYLVGREDRSINQFAGRKRKSLDSLMVGVDRSRPIILMDHQPFQLDEASKAGADLQLSGHTHHGQLWPLNYITKMVYQVSWGYEKIGDTHYYISCGFGSWGPPIRLGHRPEVILLTLTFN